MQTEAQLPKSCLAKQQEHPSTDQDKHFLVYFSQIQPPLVLRHHHTTYNLILHFTDLPHLLALLTPILLATKFPYRKCNLHSPSQNQPTLLEPVNYISALSFMQVLPQKLLLLEIAKWQNKSNEKEGGSTAFFNFKSTCVRKTKLTGWRAPLFGQGFRQQWINTVSSLRNQLHKP